MLGGHSKTMFLTSNWPVIARKEETTMGMNVSAANRDKPGAANNVAAKS